MQIVFSALCLCFMVLASQRCNPFNTLRAISKIFNSILEAMLSKQMDAKIGEMCFVLMIPVKSCIFD